MQVQSLGREDPLEKEMATHSSILAWRRGAQGSHGQRRIPRVEEDPTDRGVDSKESDMTKATEHAHSVK